ncbi:MAG: Na+/H+ antiporter NhaC family protein [Tissierellia bacterium]|nr:Na+/H+ antiporter NhaC family protein [Tissierellia bacterium]
MEEVINMGWISIVPALIAIILSFISKNTILSLSVACIVGTALAGDGIFGFPTLLKESVGSTSFAWIMLLNTFIAILVAFFRRTGAIQGFAQAIQKKNYSRNQVQIIAWLLGMFVYFSDSFSPLFVGTTMREVSDSKLISREKLSYIADSGAAPVSVLVPITGWAAFLSGLAIDVGNIKTQDQAMSLFLKAIPFNLYALVTIVFVGLIASGIIKDFGPMKKAEKRAMEEKKVLGDDAKPLIGKELTELAPYEGLTPRVFLNFILPVLLIMSIALATFFIMKSAKTMEAFLAVVIFMIISMSVQKVPFDDIMDTLTTGVKGAVPAIMLLALAYSVNNLSTNMGTANFIIEKTEGFLSPALLPALTFLIAAIMAFSTGSSWGTFAIVMPIALPLAFQFTGNEVTILVAATFAAVAGGGVFGDHCSPLSDTTVLASTGSAADHIDHVRTQLPYALITGAIALVLYLVIGFTMI